ncbi:kinase-like domain-containing protein [Syncephalis plumigaleata]|nr:kinase-like domain-containing protein [Syncephalis plumigaleata]KAI8053104.1 kinase-like domain-containing protein [Syncephalis plumigaleata]
MLRKFTRYFVVAALSLSQLDNALAQGDERISPYRQNELTANMKRATGVTVNTWLNDRFPLHGEAEFKGKHLQVKCINNKYQHEVVTRVYDRMSKIYDQVASHKREFDKLFLPWFGEYVFDNKFCTFYGTNKLLIPLRGYLREMNDDRSAKTYSVLTQLVKATIFLHHLRIAHGNLNLDNILVFRRTTKEMPRIILSGFEHAIVFNNKYDTMPRDINAVTYMPPEYFPGERNVVSLPKDVRMVDSWSIGVIAYIMATASPDFDLKWSGPMARGYFRYIYKRKSSYFNGQNGWQKLQDMFISTVISMHLNSDAEHRYLPLSSYGELSELSEIIEYMSELSDIPF